jgi:hypothetical protein
VAQQQQAEQQDQEEREGRLGFIIHVSSFFKWRVTSGEW